MSAGTSLAMCSMETSGSSIGSGLHGPSGAVGNTMLPTSSLVTNYFIVPWVTEPASWRWKMTYITSTGKTVMITAANNEPKSTE